MEERRSGAEEKWRTGEVWRSERREGVKEKEEEEEKGASLVSCATELSYPFFF